MAPRKSCDPSSPADTFRASHLDRPPGHSCSSSTSSVVATVHRKDGSGTAESEPDLAPAHPEGGLGAWLSTAGSFLCMMAVYGTNNSVGVLQAYWVDHQLAAYAARDIAWISGVCNFMSLFLGLFVGPLFDRVGPRRLLPWGTALFVAGLAGLVALPDFASDYQQHHAHGAEAGRARAGKRDVAVPSAGLYAALLILWGFVMGGGGAVIGCVAVGSLAHWFERRRGTAMAVAFVGSSLGGVFFPMVFRPLLDSRGWRVTMVVLLVMATTLLMGGNVLIKGRLPGRRKKGPLLDLKCFRDGRFVWTSIAVSCQCICSFFFSLERLAGAAAPGGSC